MIRPEQSSASTASPRGHQGRPQKAILPFYLGYLFVGRSFRACLSTLEQRKDLRFVFASIPENATDDLALVADDYSEAGSEDPTYGSSDSTAIRIALALHSAKPGQVRQVSSSI